MFLKTRYQTCEDFQGKEKKFILESPTLTDQLTPNQWVILAVLLSYYLFLRHQQNIIETIQYTRGKDSKLTANLRNGINVPGIPKTIKLSNQTLTQNVNYTLFTVPTGKRYLLHQVISFFKTNSSLGIEFRHVDQMGVNFLLSKFNNNISGRGLFTENVYSLPLNSSSSPTLNYFNVFHPLIMFEEGESFRILNTNPTQLTNIDFKYMYWEIDASDNVPIKSFFKQILPDTPQNELFSADSSGPAFLLGPYEYINPQNGNLINSTQPLNTIQSSTIRSSAVLQVNNGVVNIINATGVGNTFVIPYFYIQDDLGNPYQVSLSFTLPISNLQMPGLQVIAIDIPAGKTLYAQNSTGSGWTPANVNGNFYGTYYQF